LDIEFFFSENFEEWVVRLVSEHQSRGNTEIKGEPETKGETRRGSTRRTEEDKAKRFVALFYLHYDYATSSVSLSAKNSMYVR
jgi:hypothetical protein